MLDKVILRAAAAVLLLGSLGWLSAPGATQHPRAQAGVTVDAGAGTPGNWGWE